MELTFQIFFSQVQRVLLQRGVRASVVRADGYGSEFDGYRPPATDRYTGGRESPGPSRSIWSGRLITGGSKARGGRGAGGGGGGQHVHNRRVTFNIIQEIKIQGNIQFGAMSRCSK